MWSYNDWFVDENNVERPMSYDGDSIMSGPNSQGTRAFGQIMDPAFNYQSSPFAPKTWVQEDPAQRSSMMQSSPIIIPSRVNACSSANVCDPAKDKGPTAAKTVTAIVARGRISQAEDGKSSVAGDEVDSPADEVERSVSSDANIPGVTSPASFESGPDNWKRWHFL
ncbi:hypothetical protein OY671_010481, partial [Metschnikowia pulcherrima]